MTAVTASSLVFNLVMSTSLQALWGAINALQMIVHIPLFSLHMPSNALIFFNTLISVARFDIIPAEKINTFMFDFSNSENSYNTNFENLGY
mmetsp:Transcript_20625/g.19616  ORF Transcript_20625/g.19616 Transcript_20625/m.19616 type:complete len:91 (+) Transcript_20625:2363-2635(+)